MTCLSDTETDLVRDTSCFLMPLLDRPDVPETELGQSLGPQFLFGEWVLGSMECFPSHCLPTSHPSKVGIFGSVTIFDCVTKDSVPWALAPLSSRSHESRVYLCPPWSLVWLWAPTIQRAAKTCLALCRVNSSFCQFPGARNTCIGRSGARALGTSLNHHQGPKLLFPQPPFEIGDDRQKVSSLRALNTCIGSSGARALMTEPTAPFFKALSWRSGTCDFAGVYLACWRLCFAGVYLCISFGISVYCTPSACRYASGIFRTAWVQGTGVLQSLPAPSECTTRGVILGPLVCSMLDAATNCSMTWIEQQAQSAGCILAGMVFWALLSLLCKKLVTPRPKLAIICMKSWMPFLPNPSPGTARQPQVRSRHHNHRPGVNHLGGSQPRICPARSYGRAKGPGNFRLALCCWIFGFCSLPCAVDASPLGLAPVGLILCTSVESAAVMTTPDRHFWAAGPTHHYRMHGRPLRPHEIPVEEQVTYVGPPVPRPGTQLLTLPDDDSALPWVHVFDEPWADRPHLHEVCNPSGADAWLGCLVYTPYVRTVSVAVRCKPYHQLHHCLAIVLDSAPHADPYTYNVCIPTRPQLHSGMCTFLRFPSTARGGEARPIAAVLVDLSCAGGHCYASYMSRVTEYEDFMTFIYPQIRDDDQLVVYIGDSRSPLPTGRPLHLQDGDVVSVRRQSYLHVPTAAEIVEDRASWIPAHHVPACCKGEGVLVQYQDNQFFMQPYRHSGSTVAEAISHRIGRPSTALTSCCFRTPDLELQGDWCGHVVMVVDLPPEQTTAPRRSRRRDTFILCDFRPLGQRMQVVHCHTPILHLPSIAALHSIYVPPNTKLMATGGQIQGDEVHVDGHCVLTFYLEPSSSDEEDAPDMAPPSDRGQGDNHEADDPDDPGDDPAPGDSDRPYRQPWPAIDCSRRSRSRSAEAPTRHRGELNSCCSPTAAGTYDKSSFKKSSSRYVTVDNVTVASASDILPCQKLCRVSSNLAVCKGPAGPRLGTRAGQVGRGASQGRELAELEPETPYPAQPPILQVQHPGQDLAEAVEEGRVEATCLIYAPGYIPDIVTANLPIPCSVNQAVLHFVRGRDQGQADCFDQVFPASPQPAPNLAVLVASPSWVQDKVVVLFNCLAVNRMLFAAAVHPYLNKGSLLAAAGAHVNGGIQDQGPLDVFVFGLLRPLEDDQWVAIRSGMTICCVPAGQGPVPGWNLDDMLQDQADWERDPAIPGPPPAPGNHYLVLTDAMPYLFKVTPGRRRFLKHDMAHLLRCGAQALTLLPTTPRVIDCVGFGLPVWTVLVATEQLQVVPFPPARHPEHRVILILDCRAILLDFQWRLLQQPTIAAQTLADQFADRCPASHLVVFRGTDMHQTDEGYTLQFSHGQVVKVEFVEESVAGSSSDTSGGDDSDSDTSMRSADLSPATEAADTVPHSPHAHPADEVEEAGRSRSPRGNTSAPARNLDDSPTEAKQRPYVFGILAPGFVIETVTVNLPTPVTMHETIKAIQIARAASYAQALPMLSAVRHQPTDKWGLFISTPIWGYNEAIVCVDMTSSWNRIFAVCLPTHTHRHRILVAAGLSAAADVDLFLNGDCPVHDSVALRDGDCITVVWSGFGAAPCRILSDLLAVPWFTDAAPAFPADAEDDHFLLVGVDGSKLFTMLPQRLSFCHADIASRIGCPPSELMLVPGRPMPVDVAKHGFFCRNALAALSIGHMPAVHTLCVCLVDTRRLLLDWQIVATPDGWLHAPTVLAACGSHLPDSWEAYLVGLSAEQEWFSYSPGDIFQVAGRPMADASQVEAYRQSQALETPGATSSHSHPPDLTSGGSRETLSADVHDSTLPADLGKHTTLTRLAPTGLGDMWSIAFPEDALLESMQCLTPVSPAWIWERGYRVAPVDIRRHVDSFCNHLLERFYKPDPLWPRMLCRLLQEPVSVLPGIARALAAAREATHRLGLRRPFPPHFLPIQDAAPDDISDQVSAGLVHANFVLLAPEYTPEVAPLHIVIPQSVDDILDLISTCRNAEFRDLFPNLIPVFPQPDPRQAFILVSPIWPCDQTLICLDLTLWDGRVFAVLAPTHSTRHILLNLAGFVGDAEVYIFLPGLDGPFEHGREVQLQPGDCVLFVPPGEPIGPAVALAEMLQSPIAWDARATCFSEGPADRFCLVGAGFHRDFLLQPHRAMYYRQDIALMFAVAPHALVLTPARDHANDISLYGRECRTAVAVGSTPAAGRGQSVLALLDCRAIFEGWTQTVVSDGWLDADAVRRHFSRGSPRGFQVCLSGCPQHWRWLYLEAGQVVRIFFQFEEDQSITDPDTADDPTDSSQYPGFESPADSSGLWRAHGTSGSLDENGTSHATGEGGDRWNRASAALLCLLLGEVFAYALALAIQVVLWHLPADHSRATSRMRFQIGSMIPPRRQPRPRPCTSSGHFRHNCLRWGLLAGVCMCAAQGTNIATDLSDASLAHVGDRRQDVFVSSRTQSDIRPSLKALPRRALPTPCRSLAKHPTLADDIGPLQTLLESSLQLDDCPAMFLAATLIETLLEHFQGVDILFHARSNTQLNGRFSLPLGDLIPDADMHGTSIWPRFLQPRRFTMPPVPSGPESCESLYIGDMALGFTLSDIESLVHAPVALVGAEEAVQLCPALQHWTPSFFRQSLYQLQPACPPGDLICYTDGSFTPSPRVSVPLCGWACIFIDPHALRMSISFGACPNELCSPTHFSAYVGECTALLAAALISTTAYQWTTVHFYTDCVAATAAAAGTASYALGGIAQACRNVSSLRKAIGHTQDTHRYVPGHSSCFGNDLADALSKHGAKQGPAGCGLRLHEHQIKLWFQNGGQTLTWASMVLRRYAGDLSLPPINSRNLGNDCHHDGKTAQELLAPFLPPGAFADRATDQIPASTVGQPLWLRLVTFNTLSLGDAAETSADAALATTGLAYHPGRPQMLAAQLANHEIHAACLQETRCEPGSLRTGGYLRYCSGAQRGQWGVEWWFKEDHNWASSPNVAPLQVKASHFTTLHADPRRLLLRMTCDKLKVVFVGLHAPHRATEHGSLIAWWDATHRLIREHARNHPVVLAGDMNASVGSVSSPFVGEHGEEQEDVPGEALHAILMEFEILLPATWAAIHHGPNHTYVQKRGQRLCRPDFIGVPPNWVGSDSCSFLVPDINAGHACPDHVAAVFDARIPSAPLGNARPLRGRSYKPCLITAANKADVESALQSFQDPSWEVSVHAHAAALTYHVQKALGSITHKTRAQPHRSYLQPASWALQQQVAGIRRSLHRLQHCVHRHRLAWIFHLWRTVGAGNCEEAVTWFQRANQATAVHLSTLRSLGSRLKKACKRDRDAYISQLADQLACSPASDVFHHLHSLLGHRRRKKFQIDPLPAIQEADGTPCQDQQATLRRWRDHFGGMEGGQPASLHALAKHWEACIQYRGQDQPWPHPPSPGDLPTETDLQRLLLRAKSGKSPGMDGIPAELGKWFSGLLAPHLHRLALKTALRGAEACGFKAGETIWFYKGKGPHHACSSYRAILLLPVWSKIIHQALRPPMKDHFEQHSPSLQLGGKTGCSVVYGCHLVRSICRVAVAAGKSHFTLFADIASAYYCVVQNLVARWEGRAPQSALSAGSTPATALDDALAGHLQQPTALREGGASTWLEALTESLQSDNFFLLRGDDTAVMTTKGSRPGSSWADLIFAALMRRILNRRDQLRGQAPPISATPVLPFDGCKTLAPCEPDAPGLDLSEVIWADDLAIPRLVEPCHAAQALGFEAGILADALLEFGFSLSFGPHKTAGLLTLRGQGSRAARKAVFGVKGLNGKVPVLLESSPGKALPLVNVYRHLGCQQCPAGSLRAEILFRAAQARAAFSEARRKVYKNPSISVRRKGFILNATVIPKLTYGAGSWGPLSNGEMRTFSGALWSFYRPLLGIGRYDDQRIDSSTCFSLLGMPSPSALLRTQRLLYLGQMLRTGPPELWAVLRADRGQAEQFQADLRWLQAYTWNTTGMPCPMQDWGAWNAFVCQHYGRFKGAVKRARGIDVCRHTVIAALTCLNRTLLQVCGSASTPEPSQAVGALTEVCIPCKRAFRSRLSWSGHAARKHGYRSHAFLCAHGTTCLGCGRCYSTSGRLRRHLETCPGCVTSWGAFVPEGGDSPPTTCHPQAPPMEIAGTRDAMAIHGIRTDVSLGLLRDLDSYDPADEQGVWDLVASYVEPIEVLRATVRAWASSSLASDLLRITADNILLLLDVELLADHIQPTHQSSAFPQEAVPCWKDPGRAPFVLSGKARTFPLEPPPTPFLHHSDPASMRLRDAVAFSTWLESGCDVIARALTTSSAYPVQVRCPKLDTALGPATGWLRAAGFTVDHRGLRSPRE